VLQAARRRLRHAEHPAGAARCCVPPQSPGARTDLAHRGVGGRADTLPRSSSCPARLRGADNPTLTLSYQQCHTGARARAAVLEDGPPDLRARRAAVLHQADARVLLRALVHAVPQRVPGAPRRRANPYPTPPDRTPALLQAATAAPAGTCTASPGPRAWEARPPRNLPDALNALNTHALRRIALLAASRS
jgi:hypothetical protein